MMDWLMAGVWWLLSTFAILGGGFFAVMIGFVASGLLREESRSAIESNVASLIFLSIVMLILAAAVGIAQAWLLRQRIPIAQWFWATVAGGAIAVVLTGLIGLPMNRGYDVAPIAAWVGTAIAQWFVLKRYSRRAIAWPIAAMVASGITWFYPLSAFPSPPSVIALYGLVTAILIVLILQRARSRTGGADAPSLNL